MHVGTLRTALYDYFLARQSGGQFIIRIEDTDQGRLVPGAVESLLKTFQTLGLDYDEGPILLKDGTLGEKGKHGPYVQSQRLNLYRKYVIELVKAGHAYPCFCTMERLEQMRQEQMLSKQAPKYDRHCLALSDEEVNSKLKSGESHVIRMKIPEGSSTFVDSIRGEITFQNSEVDDQVLLKSDGFPTYHLAVVVDDYLMKITHVLRGEEWISSTPKQIILHKMFGWEMPVYAHVPLILNPDRTKMSKRKGDVSVESFLQRGYLPETLINFLPLLGWNPTGDREIYSREELIRFFDLSKVNKSGAIFDREKLDWMNGHYLRALDEGDYFKVCRSWIQSLNDDPRFLDRACQLVRDRVKVLDELPSLVGFLFQQTLEYDPALLQWKKQSREEARAVLIELRKFLDERPADQFILAKDLENDLRQLIADRGWEKGNTLWPLRVALSGQKQSPGPFELLAAYGKQRSLQRIDEAVAHLA
jgi:glutamyl-tRNA synthetase